MFIYILMKGLTPLQRKLMGREKEIIEFNQYNFESLNRSFHLIEYIFSNAGINLRAEIDQKLRDRGEITVVDFGCGSGIAIEEVARKQGGLAPWSDLYIKGNVNTIGVDINCLNHKLAKQEIPLTCAKVDEVVDQKFDKSEFDRNWPDARKSQYIDKVSEYRKQVRKALQDRFYTQFINSDVTSVPEILDNSVDVLWSVATMQYVPDGLKMIEEIYRVLKIGGKAFVTTVFGDEDIAHEPSFSEILESTYGASDCIQMVGEKSSDGRYPKSKIIIIEKKECFDGKFPYVFQYSVPIEGEVFDRGRPVNIRDTGAAFFDDFVTAIYKKVD